MNISPRRADMDYIDDISGARIQRHQRTINDTTWHFQRRTYLDGSISVFAHAPGKPVRGWYGRP